MSAPDATNILVVDDLPEKLLAYRSILEELGQNLVTVRSGREALAQVLKTDFAVILLDVQMPEMDGLETAALIRKRRRSAHTPIIFLTAFADEVRAAEGYAHGAVDYISTPVVPEILRAKVRVFVDLYRMTQQVKKQAEERVALAEERTKRAAAEEANRRKDEFLSMLAHELRNPLAPIRNAVEVMRHRAPAQPELVWARDVIDRQVRHLTRLVDDLLDVSRITTGKIRLQTGPVNLAEVVGHAVEASRPVIDARRHKLDVALPPGPAWVTGDPARLAQVLTNLLNNAAKYTDEGGRIALTIEPDGGVVRVRVRDTGIGIPADMLSAVFEPFTQMDRSLDRSQGGLGVGLSLVKRLVEMHGGTVAAHSEGPGAGSEFVIVLPAGAGAGGPAAGGEHANGTAGRFRVLVVDDNKDAAETMATLLRLDRHEVRQARDWESVAAAVPEFAPDVVLLDIGLPGVDGYEIARRLKARPDARGAVLVAVTGYGRDEDRRLAREAGFEHHLTKPVEYAALQQLFTAIRSGSKERPALTQAAG